MERIRNKVFSLDEANGMIPLLEQVLADLTTLGRDITTLRRDIEVLSAIESAGASTANADVRSLRAKEADYVEKTQRFHHVLSEVTGRGCLVRDLEVGLVDFYTVSRGRVVCLCWRRGEARIGYWHPVDEGFSGRRPLEDLL